MVLSPTFPLLVVLPLSLIGLLPSDLLAQPQAPAPQGQRDEPTTKFDMFILSKGVVRVREFYERGTMAVEGIAKFEVARAYTPGRTDYVLALRIDVQESGRPNRQRIGVMDADEVASLAAALPQMTKMIETLKQGQQAQNTEVDYRGGSLRVGVFVTGARTRGFIQVGDVSPVNAFFDVKELEQLSKLVGQAAAKIKELQRSK
jgi:hypothetical protein